MGWSQVPVLLVVLFVFLLLHLLFLLPLFFWLVFVFFLFCLLFFFVAEAAVAVGVVEFSGGVAECFGAVSAGAERAVGEIFAGQADFTRRSDFLLVGGEDDALDGVLESRGRERTGLEVGGGGAVGAGDGVGLAWFELAFDDGLGGEVEVDLDGGAVFRELEGDADGAVAFGARGDAALAGVVVAEAAAGDGGGLAEFSGGHDVAAHEVRHGGAPEGCG